MSEAAIVDADKVEIAPRQFELTARQHGASIAYRTLGDNGWESTNWSHYLDEVRRAARALIALGVKKGDAVCILGFNKPEWTIMAFAAMMVGGKPAGIYFTSSPEEIAYILNHSDAPVLLAETDEHFARVAEVRKELKTLRHVVMMRGARSADKLQMSWQEFNDKGEDRFNKELDERIAAIAPADAGTLIYTSGTTGPPKAVVLSHRSLAWTAETIGNMGLSSPEDRILSYLPLAHIAEAMNSIHGHARVGYEVWFAQSIDLLGQHLKDCRPTIFFGVPRVWQKMHETLQSRLGEATGVKAKLAAWSLKVGREHSQALLNDQQPSGLLAFKHRIADKLVLSKIRDALGLNLCRFPVSGAAPISSNILDFFASLGIIIYEVYGQSEDCGPTTFNLPGAIKFGSVGKAVPGLEVRIADDDEILVRSPSVFDGYAKDEAATAETFIKGWMHTGDLGRVDNHGFVYVTGRKKDIIITSGGKNITPANLEGDLMDISLVEHAVVAGDGEKFLTAVLTLQPEILTGFLQGKGIKDDSNVRSHPEVLGAIQSGVDAMNDRYARVENIRKFAILDRQLTMEDDELTPTLKVKRKKVLKNHEAVVRQMYQS